MQFSKSTTTRMAVAAVAACSALVMGVVALVPAAAQTTSPTATSSVATSPTDAATPSPTSSPEPTCNGTPLNGFLIMYNNELPNAFCPDFGPVMAAGPYNVYGLDLPKGDYRLVSAGHPAHSPDVTTVTYVPTSGVADGEGYVTVSVTTTYKRPSVVNIPRGGAADSWADAGYLPGPGVANISAGQSTAEWIGPGGLYTLSIDSAHSSLTLEQAAALLVPVDLSELQAQLSPTSTPQAPATGTGAANGRGSEREAVVLGGGLTLLLLSLGLIRAALDRRR